MALKEGNTVTKIHVGQAQEKDRKETNFIAAVNRMIQAGRDLPETVDSLEGHTLKLRYGSDASALESDIGLCEVSLLYYHRESWIGKGGSTSAHRRLKKPQTALWLTKGRYSSVIGPSPVQYPPLIVSHFSTVPGS